MTYDSLAPVVVRCRCVLTALALFFLVHAGHAQSISDSAAAPVPADSTQHADNSVSTSNSLVERMQTFDQRLFRQIYAIDNRAFRSFVYISDATSYRVFYAGVPVAMFYSSLDGDGDWSDVYRLALSELLTLGASMQLKNVFERDRPPHELAGTGVRIRSDDGSTVESKSYAFPSGHAAIAAALVTSWSLSYPEWYVIAPGVLWASSVAVSRIWRGRHFPGDTVGGILIGSAVATAVHLLDPLITPAFLKADDSRSTSSPQFMIVIPLP